MRYRYGACISLGWPHELRLIPKVYGLPEGTKDEKGLRFFWLTLQLVFTVARTLK